MQKVRIIAPSSIIANPYKKLEEAAVLLKSYGFDVSYNSNLFGDPTICRFYANTKKFRQEDLKDAILDDGADIIWAFRGGYGAGEIVEEMIALRPNKKKILIGFSDITPIGALFTQIFDMPFLHASGLTSLIGAQQNHIHDIKEILDGKKYSTSIETLNEAAKFGITGKITGGNLCLIQTMIGTKLPLDASGKILFLEDVGEPGYKVARMLNHLEKALVLSGIVGCILGDFSNSDQHIEYVLSEFINRHNNIPFYRIKSGHNPINYPIIMGISVDIPKGGNTIEYNINSE